MPKFTGLPQCSGLVCITDYDMRLDEDNFHTTHLYFV